MLDIPMMFAAFDPFSLLGPLLTGGLNLMGSMNANEQNAQTNFANMNYNSNQAEAGRIFSAQQADRSREFTGSQFDKTLAFNAQEAERGRNFADTEGQYARNFTAQQADYARGFSRDEAKVARDFSERMSSTAYQRATADMKAAGINPMVAFSQGGASTPGSSMASSSGGSASAPSASSASSGGAGGSAMASSPTASISGGANFQNIFQHAISSALETAKTDPIVKGLHQDVETKKFDTDLRAKQVRTEVSRGNQVDALEQLAKAEADKTDTENQLREQELAKAKEDSKFYGSKVGEWSRFIGNIGREAAPVATSAEGLARTINPFMRR